MLVVEDTNHGYVLYKDGVAVAMFKRFPANLNQGGKMKQIDFINALQKLLGV